MKNLAARDLDIVETAITAAARAFADSRFLVVFDAFESYLGPSNELADDVLQSILNAVIRVPGETKLRRFFEPTAIAEQTFDALPTGTFEEHEVAGLPDEAVAELLVECGLTEVDNELRRRITTYVVGNPTLIKLYCSLVIRRHQDPNDAVTAIATKPAVTAVVEKAIDGLSEASRISSSTPRGPQDSSQLGRPVVARSGRATAWSRCSTAHWSNFNRARTRSAWRPWCATLCSEAPSSCACRLLTSELRVAMNPS